MLSHEEIPGTVVLKNSGNPGSVVAQGPIFTGGVGVVFQLPSMGEPGFFTGTALTLDVCGFVFGVILIIKTFIILLFRILAYI